MTGEANEMSLESSQSEYALEQSRLPAIHAAYQCLLKEDRGPCADGAQKVAPGIGVPQTG
jgi:hypothetical protein